MHQDGRVLLIEFIQTLSSQFKAKKVARKKGFGSLKVSSSWSASQCENYGNSLIPFFRKNSVKSMHLFSTLNYTEACCFHEFFLVRVNFATFHTVRRRSIEKGISIMFIFCWVIFKCLLIAIYSDEFVLSWDTQVRYSNNIVISDDFRISMTMMMMKRTFVKMKYLL